MDSDASATTTTAQGHSAVVSNLKDIFNKRIAQQESEVVSRQSSSRQSRTPEKAPVARSRSGSGSGGGEKVKGTDLPAVLITNDDGIGAPGLRALVSALVEGGRCDVHVSAPDS